METALVAACIAAGAAIVAAVVSWFGAFQNRRTADRDHAWRRFTRAVSPHHDRRTHNISTAVLRELESVAWWSERDRRLAGRALRRRAMPDRPDSDDQTQQEGPR